MKLIDYIKDVKMATATEIFNAKFKTAEDVAEFLDKLNQEKLQHGAVVKEFNETLYNIKVCLSHIAMRKEQLRKLQEFKVSHIANLIDAFTKNNTDEALDAIRNEISESNPFGVSVLREWQKGDRERAYGLPMCACIVVHYADTFYRYDNFDIDNDIKNAERRVAEAEHDIVEWIEKKSKMYDEHGFDALSLLFDKFIEEYGGLVADKDWYDRNLWWEEDEDCCADIF